MAEDEVRRRLTAEYKKNERERTREQLLLTEAQLVALLAHLDDANAAEVCDHTARLTRAWAAEHAIDPDALAASLETVGGYCDCEVLFNVDPDEIF